MAFTPEEAKEVGTEIGIVWEDVEFDPEDLAAGMDVELEHGSKLGAGVNVTDDDPAATAKIAWAHLMESPVYYELLAEMEARFDEGEPQERSAYQIQVDPSKKFKKPQLSPEMEQHVKQYVKDLELAVRQGMSADDAFKEILPDLDDLEADDLVNLLWENQHLGGRGSMQRFKDWLPALDIFDMIQKLLERAVWESAVYWWSTQKTEKQQQEEKDSTETVVLKKKKPAGDDKTTPIDEAPTTQKKTSEFRFNGHLYRELIR